MKPYVRQRERGFVPVTAYCLTWDPTPAVSRTGVPYFEAFDRHAFDEQLETCYAARSYDSIQCLFNHGTDVDGREADAFNRSLGDILEITADEIGLLTNVAYNKSVLCDEALRMMFHYELDAYSMRAAVHDPVDLDSTVKPYQVVTIRKARLKEFGPNVNPRDVGAKILDIAGITPRRRATWVAELNTLRSKAEALDARARAITGEIAAVAEWERRNRNRSARRREPAPRLTVTRGMTSSQRWSARGEAEREAERLGAQARQLLAEHGYTKAA